MAATKNRAVRHFLQTIFFPFDNSLCFFQMKRAGRTSLHAKMENAYKKDGFATWTTTVETIRMKAIIVQRSLVLLKPNFNAPNRFV